MTLHVIDTDISMEVHTAGETFSTESLQQRSRSRGHEVANSWFQEEVSRIRTEGVDRLVSLLDTLHESCMLRIREALVAGYGSSSIRPNKTSRALSALTDELTDLQAVSAIKDDVEVAFGRFDDTRQQAVSATLKAIKAQIREARTKALVIETQIAALEVIQQ